MGKLNQKPPVFANFTLFYKTRPRSTHRLYTRVAGFLNGSNEGNDMSTMMIEMTDCAVGGAAKDVDGAILRRIRGGEPEAFALLIARYQTKVFSILRRYERDSHKVEDLAQETFLKAWRALDQFSAKSPFEHWLSRIATNVARDHLRRLGSRIRETGFEDLGEDTLDWLDAGRGGRQLQVNEARQLLDYALERLTPTSRMVLTMREIEGRSLKEVSELTGLSVASVKIRCHRAKAKMREALEKLCDRDRAAEDDGWQLHMELAPLAI